MFICLKEQKTNPQKDEGIVIEKNVSFPANISV